MNRTIHLTRLLPYAPEVVWSGLTDATKVSKWLMPTDRLPLSPGNVFTFRMAPQRGWDGVTHCEIVTADAPHTLSYTYRGQATGEKALRCAGIDAEAAMQAGKGFFAQLDTLVTFTLVADPSCDGTARTRLSFEQTGYRGLKMSIVSYIMEAGWRKLLDHRLPDVLAEEVAPSKASIVTAWQLGALFQRR